MKRTLKMTPPFFEIGPKNYLYGQDVIALAKVADAAAKEYQVNVIYTTPYVNIADVAATTSRIYVFAPHMDVPPVGRGLANVLPESLKAAGAHGVMLNHVEKPLGIAALSQTIERAHALELMTIACADGTREAAAVAALGPDMIVCEPTALIGTGQAAGGQFVKDALAAVRSVDPRIGVLIGGGVSSGQDVYDIMMAGADATGSSSGIVLARDPAAMVYEMVQAVRQAWDERENLLVYSKECQYENR